jgi:hypothetical protein
MFFSSPAAAKAAARFPPHRHVDGLGLDRRNTARREIAG